MKIPFPSNPPRRRLALAGELLAMLLLSLVLLYSGVAPAHAQLPLEFSVYDAAVRGGVNIATGSINENDDIPEIVVAPKTGLPLVRILDGRTGAVIRQFSAYDTPTPGGVQVAISRSNDFFDGTPLIVTAPGVGSEPIVKVFDANNGVEIRRFTVIAPEFRGGVRIATLSVNNVPMVAAVPESNAPPLVRLYRIADGSLFSTFFAFDPAFEGGLTIATEPRRRFGSNDNIVIGAGPGGSPVVRVFSPQGTQRGAEILAFDANFRGGVRVALQPDFQSFSGAINIVVAPGPGGTPLVRAFDFNTRRAVRNFVVGDQAYRGGLELASMGGGTIFDGNGPTVIIPPAILVTGGADSSPIVQTFDGRMNLPNSFFAFDAAFVGGVRVALGDVNGDGSPDAVTAAGEGGLPLVAIFDGRTGLPNRVFFAFDMLFRGGITVATADTDGDGKENIVVGAGRGGQPAVGIFDDNGTMQSGFLAFDAPFRGGVNVTAGAYRNQTNAVVGVAPLSQGISEVRLFQPNGAFLQSVMAYEASYTNGVNISLARSFPRLVVAPSGGAALPVRVFAPTQDNTFSSPVEFFPYGEFFEGGVTVSTYSFSVLTGPQGGTRPLVKRFEQFGGIGFTQSRTYQPFDPAFRGPVYVAGVEVNGNTYDFLISAGQGVPVVQRVTP